MVPEERVRPERDAVDPDESTQYAKWRMNVSIDASARSGLTIVVPGAASIPMTPPRSAQARITGSGLHLLIGQQLGEPEWQMQTGRPSDASIVSSEVRRRRGTRR